MNLATLIDPHPDDAVALVSRGNPTTYGELREQVARLRGGLVAAGVEPGDRVALAAANNWFFVVSYLAILGCGAVAVPLNPSSPTAEIVNELTAIGARVLIAGPAARDAIQGAKGQLPALEHVFVPHGTEVPGAESFDSLMTADPAGLVDRADSDVAVLIFTAGTAGSPKAAMLTHGNLRANLEQAQGHPGGAVRPSDVAFGVLPMFHIFGLNVVLGLTLYAGASVVLVERFDPATALETIRNHRVTMVAGAPPMFASWASMVGAGKDDMATVRLALTGAAPLAEEVARGFEARFEVPLRQGYGLTEAAPVVTAGVIDGPPRWSSVGVPLPGVEVRLVDPDGEDVLEGDEGEVWVRGDNVFAGYWENAAATATAISPEGWLRTGDIGVTDEDGFLYLVDRAKDVVIVSGFNVFPTEVEDVLSDHPGVAEVAVVGVPHPHSGETVKAFVVPASGVHAEEDDLIEFCAGRLARYKCPTKIMFVETRPHGLAGKLLRRALR